MKKIFWLTFAASLALSTVFSALFLFFPDALRSPARLMFANVLFCFGVSFAVAALLNRKVVGSLDRMQKTLDQMNAQLLAQIQTLSRERGEMVAILTSMIEGVLVIDKDEKVALVNSACAKMFGWNIREARERPYWEVLRHRELSELIRNCLRKGSFENAEISIYTPEEKILHAQASPILAERETKRGAVCVLHDITSIKKMERMSSEFVANVSHELKTPLTSIKGFVETLQNGALEDRATALQFLKIVDEHTMRLDRLIGELLDLARLENRETPLQLKTVEAAALIERVRAFYADRLAARRQTLTVRAPGSVRLTADERKLEQLLENLIENAIKYTPPDGKITVEAEDAGDRVRLRVRDTGIGIPENHLPRIFDRFYRVDKSRSREEGGTGLGLSIVKQIVEAHHGDISVQSEVNRGTEFTVHLPK